MSFSLNSLYRQIGISKQAVNRQHQRQLLFDARMEQLLYEAEMLRAEHPGCGVEKMYYALRPSFVGRDRFIELFMDMGFRLQRRRNYRRTTYAGYLNYPNLIKGLELAGPGMVWQSDITYIELGQGFCYAVFIIDVYSKVIVGYRLSGHMRATANIEALRMAIKQHGAPQIHHSDRGSQYTSHVYLALLKKGDCKISMAESAQDNAYAERINRTIKEEYIDHWKPKTLQAMQKSIRKAVDHYNNQRPHNHLNRMTPVSFLKAWENGTFKPVITIFDNND